MIINAVCNWQEEIGGEPLALQLGNPHPLREMGCVLGGMVSLVPNIHPGGFNSECEAEKPGGWSPTSWQSYGGGWREAPLFSYTHSNGADIEMSDKVRRKWSALIPFISCSKAEQIDRIVMEVTVMCVGSGYWVGAAGKNSVRSRICSVYWSDCGYNSSRCAFKLRSLFPVCANHPF